MRWREAPMPPLEGEVPNEREAEGFARKLSKKTPQSARSGCQLPFQGSQGGFAARVARLATPTSLILLTMRWREAPAAPPLGCRSLNGTGCPSRTAGALYIVTIINENFLHKSVEIPVKSGTF